MKDSTLPVLPCMCATLRRASRALTQVYEEALRPIGLRATQFTVLQALSLTGEVTQGEIGRILALDSTTLTRTLEIMVRRGWIAKRRGKDRREWRLRLSKGGEVQLKRGTQYWDKAQAQVRSKLGGECWDHLLNLSNQATSAVTE